MIKVEELRGGGASCTEWHQCRERLKVSLPLESEGIVLTLISVIFK